MSKAATLPFAFSQKHIDYMRHCRDCTINVAEGAVRAGKTVDNAFAFAYELDRSPDRIHLATGSTIANAKLNIGVCNGFGLEGIFRGRCHWGKYKDNEALFVQTPRGERIVIFAGGSKADSFKKIRGNSYGMWIATEINLHHNNTIQEAFNRQLAAARRKVFWDLNPDHPKADIYTKYIDLYASKSAAGDFPAGYNYAHFTIRDNVTISPERLREIESQYEPGSIWYRRDILGQRCIADGLIFTSFASAAGSANNPFLAATLPPMMRVVIGVDFGGTGSAHAFVATGITPGYRAVYGLESQLHPAVGTDPDKLGELFCDFCLLVYQKYGMISAVYPDSAEQVLIRGLQTSLCRRGLNWIASRIANAAKTPTNERINLSARLIAQRRFFYTKNAQTLADALASCVWDPKKVTENVRLDDGTSDIDTLDAFEYTIERDRNRLLRGEMIAGGYPAGD